jgi:hypothetical protein
MLWVYLMMSTYTPVVDETAREFGISSTLAAVPLAMNLVGFSIGPIFLTPLAEVLLYPIDLFVVLTE